MKATEFDERFDAGEDMTEHMDWSTAHRPDVTAKRVNVDFPEWMVSEIDREARRLGLTRQGVIKVWIAEHIDHAPQPA
jgi:hypothetical protein